MPTIIVTVAEIEYKEYRLNVTDEELAAWQQSPKRDDIGEAVYHAHWDADDVDELRDIFRASSLNDPTVSVTNLETDHTIEGITVTP
jgi:hypothetical protein